MWSKQIASILLQNIKSKTNLLYRRFINIKISHLSKKSDCLFYKCFLDKFQKNEPTYKLIHSSNKYCLCYQCLLDRYQEKERIKNLENLLEEISK